MRFLVAFAKKYSALVGSLMLSGTVLPAVATAEIGDAIDTTRWEFTVDGTDEQPFLVAKKPLVLPGKQENRLIMVTGINPELAASREGDWADRFFGSSHRPRTWEEATRTCQSLKWDGRDWRLPTSREATLLGVQLNYEELLLSEANHYNFIARDFHPHVSRGMQFVYFWTSDVAQDSEPDLKKAAFFGRRGHTVGMSAHRLLSTICVAYRPRPEASEASPDVARDANRARNRG